MLTRYIP